jgi:hypothetical protein
MFRVQSFVEIHAPDLAVGDVGGAGVAATIMICLGLSTATLMMPICLIAKARLSLRRMRACP